MSAHRDFGQSIGIVAHIYLDFVEQLLRPQGLTYPQFTVLLYLARRGEAARISDIARAVSLTQSAATKIVQKFVAAGWVAAGRDRSDARNRPISLTAQGCAQIAAVQATFGPAFAQLLDGFAPDDLVRVTSILQHLIQRLDAARKKLQG